MATVSVRPSRLSGSTTPFAAMSDGHQLEDLGVDLEAREVHRRHPVLPGEDLGDLQLRDQPQLDQDVAQAVLRRLLLRERLSELLAREQAVAQEGFAEPVAAAGGAAVAMIP